MDTVLFLGLGRIGLPQALVFAHKGLRVYGFDVDAQLIQILKNGKAPFHEHQLGEYLQKYVNHGFYPLDSWQQVLPILPECSSILFTIGTKAPNANDAISIEEFELNEHFSLLDKIFICQNLSKKIQLIIRTTFPLGGTDRLKKYLEDKLNLREGVDFYLAFVPERIVIGHAIQEEETLPKIIGTYSQTSYEQIKRIFERIGGPIVRVKNPITAEFCKLTDNSFRDTVFAFANEMAIHAAQSGVDAVEVINAVNYQYPRNTIPQPGFVSGYCLGKDPYIFEMGFLSKLNRNYPRDFHSLWYYGRKTNDFLIEYVALKILRHLQNPKQGIVAILGLSFKEDVDDFRMSDSLNLIQKLLDLEVTQFKLYDPNIEVDKYTMLPASIQPFVVTKSSNITPDFFQDVTSIVICHKYHDLLDFDNLDKLNNLLKNRAHPCYLFDACNIWRQAEKLKGLIYQGLGYEA